MDGASQLPPPLVGQDVDLRDFAFMPLDVLRLRDSDIASIEDAEAFRASVISWCTAWHQIPAASLPDDDVALARLLGWGRDVKGWKRVRAAGGLHGWVVCSDGRLYHPVVAEKANEAWAAKISQRARTEAARKAREDARQKLSQSPRDDVSQRSLQSLSQSHSGSVTEAVTASKGQGQGYREERTAAAAKAQSPRTPAPPASDAAQPPDDRGKSQDLEAKLRAAAGWQDEAAPKLFVVGSIQAMIDRGVDLDLDILPVIRSISPRLKRVPGGGWEYFIPAINEAYDKRLSAGKAPANPQTAALPTPEQGWRNKVRIFLEKGFWLDDWDGKPGEPDCRVPPHILAEFGYAAPEKAPV